MDQILDELFTGNDETMLDLGAQQTQLSLSPIVNTPRYAKASSPASPSSTQPLNTAFQAHQPSLLMESAATTECHQTAAKMPPERAIAVKCMYIKLIKELHDLKTSGAITEAEYHLQKDVILGQMLTL